MGKIAITYLPPGDARGSRCANPIRMKWRPERPLLAFRDIPLSEWEEFAVEEDDYSEESFP